MKFFCWMRDKLKQANPSAVPPARRVKPEVREEFSDWPEGLLAIGTFGNLDYKTKSETHQRNFHVEDTTAEQMPDFTDEVGKLQDELRKLLSRNFTTEKGKEIANLPLDKFLNCPSRLEISRRENSAFKGEEDEINQTLKMMVAKGNEIGENTKSNSFGRISISFLLKKMAACTGGFSTRPNLHNIFQESQQDKLLKVLLHKKLRSQYFPRLSSTMKILDRGSSSTEDDDDPEKRAQSNSNGGAHWVKTDSEYIVLEI